MRVLEEWQHFLEGVKEKVEIWMDHKNLEYFMTMKKLNLGVRASTGRYESLIFLYV
jgi:hypothetical protein